MPAPTPGAPRDRADRPFRSDRPGRDDRSFSRGPRTGGFDRPGFRDRGPRPGGYKSGGPRRGGPGGTRRAPEPPVPVNPEQHSVAFAATGLPTVLLDELVRAGISDPFPVQAATLPDALAGHDVLGRAPTGSGKTLAYGLAVLARCPRAESRSPKALILVPTRELAKQVAEVLVPYSRAMDRWVTAFFGGAGMARQIEDLRRGTDVAVATPGRLIDLVERGDARLDSVELVVIDEADRMADMGFTPQVRRLLDLVSEKRQILFYSATLDGDVDELVRAYLKDPVRHDIGGTDEEEIAARAAEHVIVMTKHERKFQDLTELCNGVGRAMIFVKNRFATERVADAMSDAGVSALPMHGGMSQNARETSLKRWAKGEVVALVATDVAARGVHVSGVEVVVHLDPPQDEKDYIHRSGRTARAGATGLVVNLYRKEQLRPASAMHRRLGVDVATIDLAAAKQRLADLAEARLNPVLPSADDAGTDSDMPAKPKVVSHEIWTTATVSEVDDYVDNGRSDGREGRSDYRSNDGGGSGRGFGDRPERGSRSFGDRSFSGPRSYGGGARSFGDRGPRRFDDRGPGNDRGDRGDRGFDRGDRPFKPAGDRPFDRGGDRPFRPRSEGWQPRPRLDHDGHQPRERGGWQARPERSAAAPGRFDRDAPRSGGWDRDRPASPRGRYDGPAWARGGDRPDRGPGSWQGANRGAPGARFGANKFGGDRPQGSGRFERNDRFGSGRPSGDRFNDRGFDRDRPAGDRPSFDRPRRDGAAPGGRFDRNDRDRAPRGDRPSRDGFDRPSGPRGPRADRGFGDRPGRPGRDFTPRGPRADGARPQGDRPDRAARPASDAPRRPQAWR